MARKTQRARPVLEGLEPRRLLSGKGDAIAKCEKMSPAARKCALDAKSMEELMQCPRN